MWLFTFFSCDFKTSKECPTELNCNYKKKLIENLNKEFENLKTKFKKINDEKITIQSVNKNTVQLQLNLYVNYFYHDLSAFTKNAQTILIGNYDNYKIMTFSNHMIRNNSLSSNKFQTIFSNFYINLNTFYFETTIITSGEMIIGLATHSFKQKYDKVGKDIFSIGIDGFNKCVWRNNQKYNFKNKMSSWKTGDVISIYLDKFKHIVIFGINKQIIELEGDPFKTDFCFSNYSCYVAVSLSIFQQCLLNFECKIVPQSFLNTLKTYTSNYQWFVFNNHRNMYNNDFQILTISSFAINKGSYYYEIENLSENKIIIIGWITRFVELSCFTRLDFAFDYNFQSNNNISSFRSKSKPGDIFGCYVNVNQKEIIFYCNGQQKIAQVNKIIFESLPIFAIAAVSFQQTVQFNFGHKKFRYSPNDKQFSTFYFEATQKIFKIDYNFLNFFDDSLFINDDNLSETNTNIDCIFNVNCHIFCFFQKKVIFACFDDLRQKHFDKAVLKMENMINNEIDINIVCRFIFRFLNKFKKQHSQLRFIQSVVEVIGYKIEKNKIKKLDHCISLILNRILYFDYFKIAHKFLNHYFLYFNNENINKNITKYHYFTLCMFEMRCKQSEFFCCKYLRDKSESFFYNNLLNLNDNFSQLYSFLIIKETTKFSIIEKEHDLWINKFNQLKNFRNVSNVNKYSVQYELYFYADYYQTNYFKKLLKNNKTICAQNKISLFNDKEILEEMNPNDKAKHIMLSLNNLMIRNDNTSNRTIRSKFSINVINSPPFYFETTIITVGSMRIGLAAKQMNILGNVGNNALSIGIDGFNKCVWMNNTKYKFQNYCLQWNAGDVIGIYFSSEKKNVVFGINENIIELDKNPFEEEFIFSELPCHVAVTLSQFQQCLFNFKCTVIPLVFLQKMKILSQNVPSINNAVVITNSTSTIRDINIIDFSNLDHFLRNDETTARAFNVWATANREISLAYNRVLNGNYKRSSTVTLNACELWCDQIETILSNLRIPEFAHLENLSRKIGEIRKIIKKDAETQIKKNKNNFSLMLMPASVHLKKNKFKLWLENLQIVLCSEGVAEAIESPLKKNNPLNLIARGRILLLIPQKLQTPLEKIKVAFYMMEALEKKYCESFFFTKQAKSSKRKLDQISQ